MKITISPKLQERFEDACFGLMVLAMLGAAFASMLYVVLGCISLIGSIVMYHTFMCMLPNEGIMQIIVINAHYTVLVLITGLLLLSMYNLFAYLKQNITIHTNN